MSEYNFDTKKEQVLKLRRSKKIPLIIGAAIAVFLIIVIGVIISIKVYSTETGTSLQEQLDLGNKYLNELNYEQAIIAYETAIEIDPMGVDAYLGLADTYEKQGNYDKTLEVLQLGYENTKSDLILREIERIETLISEGANTQMNPGELELDSEYPVAVPGRVVEGIYHNPYYEYPLSVEDKEYINQIIEQAELGNYEVALDMLDNDRLISIVEMFANGESYINTIVDDKKVHISINLLDNSKVDFIVLPIDSGTGYLFSKRNNTDKTETYGYGECKEGVFWGEYSWKQIVVRILSYENQEESISMQVTEGRATLNNGLFDGETTDLIKINNNSSVSTYVRRFNMGLTEYSDLQEYDSESCTVVWGYMNGEKMQIRQSYSVEEIEELFDTQRYTITSDLMYEDYCEIDGGWRYYYW